MRRGRRISRDPNRALQRALHRALLLVLLPASAACVHTRTSCGTSTVGMPFVVDLFASPRAGVDADSGAGAGASANADAPTGGSPTRRDDR